MLGLANVKVNVGIGVNVSVDGMAVEVSVMRMLVDVEAASGEDEASACPPVLVDPQATKLSVKIVMMMNFIFMS